MNNIKHIIDLDAPPYCPEGWTVEEHIGGGQFEWDPTKVGFFIPPEQADGIIGNELRKLLEVAPVMNANLLDYLVNYKLIPERWELVGMHMFFWGTIYRNSDCRPVVRCMVYDVVGWLPYEHFLEQYFLVNHPAIISKR